MAIIRRVTRIANPRKAKARARRTRVKARHKRRVTRNPVLLEFGVLNPRKKRRISVAKKRRKARRSSNPRRHAVARVHHRRRRTYNHHRRRNPHHRRRRNPGMMNKAMIENIGGAMLGLAVVRALPAMIPASLTSMIPATSFTPAIISGLSTMVATWAAHKFGGPNIAQGVAIAGGALTASQALTAMGVATTYGNLNFGVSGLGDIEATQGFSVPDRSMRAPLQMVAAPVGSGVGNYMRKRR